MPQQKPLTIKTEWEVETEPVIEAPLPEIKSPRFNFDFKKYGLIILGLVLGTVLVIGFFNYLINLSPPDNLGINVVGDNSVTAGERIAFEVVISNRSQSKIMKDLSLIVRVDDSTVLSELPISTLLQKDLGDLDPQSDYKELVPVVFWGRAQEQRKVEILVRYRQEDQSAKMEKSFTWEPRIEADLIKLSLSLPQEALSGEVFAGYFTYKNLGNRTIASSQVALEPPKEFNASFLDPNSDRQETQNRLVWLMRNLEAQKEARVNFRGGVSGGDNQGKDFRLIFSVPVRGKNVILAETREDLLVVSNPLVLEITINGRQDFSPALSGKIYYSLNFKNNYPVALKDVVVTADVSDPWFDRGSINAGTGFYSSNLKKIIWNGGNTRSLVSLDSGESEKLDFTIDLVKSYPPLSVNNDVLIRFEVSAANKPGSIGTEVLAKKELSSKIDGRLLLRPKIVFNDDPETGFVNSGSSSPKVNQVTQYSAYFRVKAEANDFKNIFVTTTFPTNVSYDGRIKGDTTDTNFVFNSRTGQMTWRIDYLPAWKEKNIIIQIGLTPSADQRGQLADILNEVKISGQDVYTGDTFSSETVPVKSDLPDDEAVSLTSGRVME